VSFDTSRYRFDPRKNYSGVVMEQGRVQLDSDWNEWLAQLSRRNQAGTLDTMGHAAYPATTPFAFQINFNPSGALVIGPGRMYVDGLLAENHGDPATVVWDPALAEMSNTPQPPPATESGAIAFLNQPYYSALGPNATLPGSGSYLAYLDVWTRAVDYLQDPTLVESAVAVDTTGRLQTVWQVGLAAVGAGTTCGNAGAPWPAASSGLLTTAPIASTPSGPCCLTDNTGYSGPENQHYRVEIHKGGPIGTATFKWSRDNASVETGITGIAAVTNSVKAAASQLTVLSMGRDQVLGFRPGDWIEILDDQLELAGLPGELHRIDTIDFAGKTITLDAPVSATTFPAPNNQPDPARHTRIRHWDHSGKVFGSDGTTIVTDLGATGSSGEIPISATGSAIILEYGITIAFDLGTAGGVFNAGDFWTFAARTDGSIDILTKAAPRGIHHHYIPLAVVDFGAGTATDCRVPWQPGGEDSCGCCTVTVGDGSESVGQYTSINAALKALPAQGGEVCILPGRYYEYVFVEGRHDIVIRGCGYQTRLASPSVLPATAPAAGAAAAGPAATGGNPDGTFNAIISVTASQHIQIRNFAVEAADNEVGILIDGTRTLIADPAGTTQLRDVQTDRSRALYLPIVIDITVEDLFLTGSTLPAILAQRVELLRLDDNRILMENIASLWPSVYVNGVEMHLDRNEIGIQSAASLREWLPANVAGDLQSDSATQQPATAQPHVHVTDEFSKIAVAAHPGGIMIAGPSKSVFVRENLIDGGRFNGITLGNYSIVDSEGIDTRRIIGLHTIHEDPCSNTGTLDPPGSGTTGIPGTSIVAGGPLIDITIDRNRIANMGLCGIGPVGFFDLLRIFEVISIENLTITNNSIRDTLLRSAARLNTFGADPETTTPDGQQPAASLGQLTDADSFSSVGSINSGSANPYAAICVPAVQNLVIRDNAVTNFGARPGIQANGIFVLNGEGVDISRNQILETRDWNASAFERATNSNALFGGIILALVTPPAIGGDASGTVFANQSAAASFIKPIYQSGMPALRIEENVVRIALGQALVAVGFGPFAISNNHFSCGGTVHGSSAQPLAQTVLIANLGASIEAAADTQWSGLYGIAKNQFADSNPYSFSNAGATARALATSRNGTVLFSNNICQLEGRADRQRSITSLFILSLDHVTFTGNNCWVDALGTVAAQANLNFDAYFDAMIAAGTVNVTANRFQEALYSVAVSGITVGIANITSQNISTYCLLIKGNAGLTVDSPNVALVGAVAPGFCERLNKL
jgi:Family of unknown function (DUF6519)